MRQVSDLTESDMARGIMSWLRTITSSIQNLLASPKDSGLYKFPSRDPAMGNAASNGPEFLVEPRAQTLR